MRTQCWLYSLRMVCLHSHSKFCSSTSKEGLQNNPMRIRSHQTTPCEFEVTKHKTFGKTTTFSIFDCSAQVNALMISKPNHVSQNFHSSTESLNFFSKKKHIFELWTTGHIFTAIDRLKKLKVCVKSSCYFPITCVEPFLILS